MISDNYLSLFGCLEFQKRREYHLYHQDFFEGFEHQFLIRIGESPNFKYFIDMLIGFVNKIFQQYSVAHANLDSGKNTLLLKNLKFLLNNCETLSQ